jgi:hypothetical protein
MPLGQMLVGYFEDSIWLGRPTNVPGDDLPYAFEQIPTGRVGLVGPMAVCQWLDGHFFLGQDGPYYLSANGVLQELGDTVASEMTDPEWDLTFSQVIPVPQLDSVFFGISQGASGISRIWVYNYKVRAWSTYEVTSGILGLEEVTATYTWDILDSAYTWDTGITGYTTWNELVSTTGRPEVWLSQGGQVLRLDTSADEDYSSNIACSFTTVDMDFGAPEMTKTFLRFSLKINKVLSSDLTFTIAGSTDLGETWKSCGDLVIQQGRTEGFVTFRMTGSTLRVRARSSNSIEQYTIIEYAVKVRGIGQEVHLDQ